MITYQQKCSICRKNLVLIKSRRQRPVCIICQEKEWNEPITDPVFKELFDFDKSVFETSNFIRSLRMYYNRYHTLTERQLAALKDIRERMKSQKVGEQTITENESKKDDDESKKEESNIQKEVSSKKIEKKVEPIKKKKKGL